MNVLWTLHGIPDVGPRGIANDSRLDPALPRSASHPKENDENAHFQNSFNGTIKS
jgi:hypothetical protein